MTGVVPDRDVPGLSTAWQVSGPYETGTSHTGPLLDVTFAPETAPDKVEWRVVDSDHAVVNLGELIGGDMRVAYLRTLIHSPADVEARLELGSDDGIKVWLNGEVVHTNDAARGHRFADDVADVVLRKGSNVLMLKITQYNQGWAASARVVGRDGEPLEGLTFSNEF